jgi:putative spermidine/putrescine transport system permease protein
MIRKWLATLNTSLGVFPAVIFLLVFFIAPFIVLVYYSLLPISEGNIIGGPSLEEYFRLLRDPFSYYLFGRTIVLSIFVTLLCVLFGYPVAYLFTKIRSVELRSVILAIVVAPLLTSSLVLSFGWIVILGKQGLVNDLLIKLGLLQEPVQILFTIRAVIIGLTQVMLPFMIVPLISTLSALPRDLEDAAVDLGATKWQSFWQVTIPQSVPGIAAGMSLVFVLTYTAFTVPTLMGGASMQIVSVYIWNNVRLLTWGTASAVSSILLGTSLAIIVIFNWIIRKLTPWQYLHG